MRRLTTGLSISCSMFEDKSECDLGYFKGFDKAVRR